MRNPSGVQMGHPPVTGAAAPNLSIIATIEDPEAQESGIQSAEISSPRVVWQPADSTKLSWSDSKIRKVLYNSLVEEWMKADVGFFNWVRTCIMMHAENNQDETRCMIPDQWRDSVGKMITIVTTDCMPGPSGKTHIPTPGVFRVMA